MPILEPAAELNIPFARRVLEHLRAHPEEHDQRLWGYRDSACGTTACIAGTALLLDPDTEVFWKENGLMDMGNVTVNGQPGLDGVERAIDLLGLTGYGVLFEQDESRALNQLVVLIQNAEHYQSTHG